MKKILHLFYRIFVPGKGSLQLHRTDDGKSDYRKSLRATAANVAKKKK